MPKFRVTAVGFSFLFFAALGGAWESRAASESWFTCDPHDIFLEESPGNFFVYRIKLKDAFEATLSAVEVPTGIERYSVPLYIGSNGSTGYWGGFFAFKTISDQHGLLRTFSAVNRHADYLCKRD